MKDSEHTKTRMNLRRLLCILKYSASVSALMAQTSLSMDDKPNIVIIVADDMGWNDVSYHGSIIKTPNIDGLVKDGIELNRFYTCPVCSPTRAGMFTGRYPIRYGLMRSAIHSSSSFGLSTEEVLLPQVLAKVGYKNRGIFGKWHLGHSDLKYHPLNRGFTYYYGCHNGAIDYFTLERDGERDWHRNYAPSCDKGYSTDLIASEAAKFIETKAGEGPFFCYVPFNAPHGPLLAPEKYLEKYRHLQDQADGNAKQIYSAMVACMDDGIGDILSSIERAGIADNTIVLFFSDNGATGRGSSNYPMRDYKGSVFEGGIRTPAVIKWPAKLKGGCKVNSPVAYIDIFPTIMRILNINDHAGKPFDGIDFFDLLTGKTKYIQREIFSYISNVGDMNERIALSDLQWKLIVLGPNIIDNKYDDSLRERLLFRIDKDPYETTNIWNEHPDVGNMMFEKLKEFRLLQIENRVLPYTVAAKMKHPQGWPPKLWNMELFPK